MNIKYMFFLVVKYNLENTSVICRITYLFSMSLFVYLFYE